MADIICRWRNGTPQTVVELVNSMPHKVMPSSDFRNYMTQHWNGDFFRTPYQLACQLGLYCEAEDGMFYPRFDHDITESEALDYLEFWITRYYVPNPYTGKDGFKDLKCPTYVLKSLYDYVVAHPDCNYSEAYKAVFHEAAKNNDDIVRNYINNYSKVLTFSKNGRLNTTGYNASKIFKFMDKNDKKGFFDSFSKPKQISLMDKYLEADIEERTQMFYNYLIHVNKSESSARQYAFLHPKKDVVLEIVKKKAGADSLFEVIDTTTIHSIYQAVNETEVNKKQNNAFSATISNYRKFIDYLEETTTEDIAPSDMLSKLLAKYREDLPSFWDQEEYKWEAVKNFQEHWNIDAEDFSVMLVEATSKHVNLLDSKMYYPIGVLKDYAGFDLERIREMFRVLFDEGKDLSERISFFSNEAEAIRKLGGDRWKNHYQDLHAISVYLTFMYPEKYFIYKYTELKKTIDRLGDDFSFPGKTPPEFYIKVVDYCEGIRNRIAVDKVTCDVLDKLISSSPDCYEDKHRNIATVDFIYYVGKRLKPEEPTIIEDGPIVEPNENSRHWIYAPGEGASMWQLCLEKGIMVLGWGKIGDYRQYESHEQLISDMQDAFNKHDKNFMHSSLAVWQFLHDMKVGDVIYVKKGLGKIIGRGVVQGDYEYDEELNERFPNKRRVHWTHVGEWDSPVGLPRKTLTRFYENSTSIFMLERLFFPDLKPAIEQIPFSIDKVIKDINETGLIYTPSLIKRFAFSLMTKPFVILSGLAGSGKTQLAITFAKALVEDTDTQLCTVSVGADWTNREPLLGFPNALQSNQYVRPESRVLDLMIEANMPENANKPYFLILDEMNMSYVERYFADFLSAMESKEAIPLWNGCLDPDSEDDDSDDTPTSIKLPSNLFIIGTINVDETTYMFSPKVLDRANVIEFKISADEMSSFLENMKDVNPDNIISKAANMAASFVEIASKNDLEKNEAAVDTLKKFFGELKNVNAEFGYRSATEIFRFICQAKNNDDTANKITDDEILDAAIVQKLLPKLHGSRKKLDPVLKQLWKLCFKKTDSESELGISSDKLPKAVFKESADKIWRMYESASANGFTSFAEA